MLQRMRPLALTALTLLLALAVACGPAGTPTPSPTPTPDPSAYLVSTCAALKALPDDIGEGVPEHVEDVFSSLTPPADLQEYHETLAEMLRFVARWEASGDRYDDAWGTEVFNRMVAHIQAAQTLTDDQRAIVDRECPSDYVDSLDDEYFLMLGADEPNFIELMEGTATAEGQRHLTREEYLDACAGLLSPLALLSLSEEYEYEVLEGIGASALTDAMSIVPPAELMAYHDLLVSYIALSVIALDAGFQAQENPDDSDARGYAANVYLQFKNLGLTLGSTLRAMDPALKDALRERGCLLKE